MENNETVAQMLRRWADDGNYLSCSVCRELGVECDGEACHAGWRILADRVEKEQRAIVDAQDGSAHKIMREWARLRGYPWGDGESITQWLEGRFLRLPLVDGKPLSKGMEIEGLDGPVDAFRIFNDGSGSVYGRYGGFLSFPEYDDPDRDSTLHLAKPKALDADGVPIEVGETVWPLAPNRDHVKSPTTVGDIAPDGRVQVTNTGGWVTWTQPIYLTHKKPDSLEKLRDDVTRTLDKSNAAFPCGREGLEEIRDRLSALIEMGGE